MSDQSFPKSRSLPLTQAQNAIVRRLSEQCWNALDVAESGSLLERQIIQQMMEQAVREATSARSETVTPEEISHLIDWHDGLSVMRHVQDDFNGEAQHKARAIEWRNLQKRRG